jgi:dipeptidyl aminopeptidase/acylaminoacyl peptidase
MEVRLRPGSKAVEALDRGISGLRSTDDGKALFATITDDMSVYPIVIAGYNITRLLPSPVVVSSFSTARGHAVCLSGNDNKPNDIYALEGKALRQITHQNDALMNELQIAQTEEVSFKSKDGTEVHGLLTYPVGYVKGNQGAFPFAHSRWAERAGSAFIRGRATGLCGEWLCGFGGELSRQLWSRPEIFPFDLC